MLGNPVGVTISTTDVDATAALFGALGFDRDGGRLSVPGADHGWIELSAAAGGDSTAGPYSPGGYDVSLYTRSLITSRDELASAGWTVGPIGHVALGPLVMEQTKVVGPDGLRVVLIESNRRRPSVLDDDADRLHSEVHSVVWCVPTLDEAVPFWREAGFGDVAEFPIDDPAVASFLELPQPKVPIRMALLSGGDHRPMRFELLEFPAELVGDPAPEAPGIGALVFELPDPQKVTGLPVTNLTQTGNSVTATAPGGVRLEVRPHDERT